MILTRLALRARILTLAAMFAVLAGGVWTVTQLQVELLPNIDFPLVTVSASYPQADQETVLRDLTEPLERVAADTGVAGFDAVQISQFESAFARAERFHQISSDLRGHAFEIHIHMPGEIVAHNADEWSEDGGALWAFDGRAFRDRPYELLAISRVAMVEPADVRSERNEIRD